MFFYGILKIRSIKVILFSKKIDVLIFFLDFLTKSQAKMLRSRRNIRKAGKEQK